jgi:hypothetical protein
MSKRALIFIPAFAAALAASVTVFAQQESTEAETDSSVQLPPAIGAAIAGLNGLVSATSQELELGRSSARLHMIRSALTAELLDSNFKAGPVTLASLKAEDVLCSVREDHAVQAADRSFVAVVSSSVQKIAAPSKIETFSAAIGSLMQSYSLSIPEAKNSADIKAGVRGSCKKDVPSFPQTFYGAMNRKKPNAPDLNKEASVQDFLSPVSALFAALNAIVTPIVTQLASVADENRRIETIAGYFKVKKHREDVIAASERLAALADRFTSNSRLMAIGRFEESLAGIRNSADASKIDFCKTALASKESRGTYKDIADSPGEEAFVPSDDFVRCYEKLWAQISEEVTTALKAADDYDKFADASGASAEARKIASYLNKITNPPAPTVKEVLAAAVKLAAFSDTVNKALSPDNRAKVGQAIAQLAKLH